MEAIGAEQADIFADLIPEPKTRLLTERFLVPPFSVLDARQGYWQARKREWLALGIRGELGRTPDAVPNSSNRPPEQDGCWKRGFGTLRISEQSMKYAGGYNKDGTLKGTSGTSVFDPVLCEIAYRWFCPPAGHVLDPFAGGSVRGIVAAILGLRYWGCDLRAEQIEANLEQAKAICPTDKIVWVVGDAIDEIENAPTTDLIFTCPPYGDLERYSDDPRDLSTMDYHAFIAAFKRIIQRACRQLRDNRFAVIVVGDFRDSRTGFYRNFVSHTIEAFEEQGLGLYNEVILVTAVGSLPIRIGKQFNGGRKIGKTHQNVLVFYKGDPKRIKDEFPGL